jgi:hypothetical protein
MWITIVIILIEIECIKEICFSNIKLVETVKEILQKYLEENKYFKVWSTNWKGQEPMPCDWWQGKVAYYKYKG